MSINPVYLEKEMQEQIRKVLEKEKVALLFDFFEEETYLEIVQMLHNLPFIHEKQPLTHSFSRGVLPSPAQNKTVFSPLHPSWSKNPNCSKAAGHSITKKQGIFTCQNRQTYFDHTGISLPKFPVLENGSRQSCRVSDPFSLNELLAFLSSILNKKIKILSFIPHSFTWKDYTLLHDEMLEKPGIDIIFDATPHWDAALGGTITYSNADVPGTVHHLPTGKNQLAIVIRATSSEQRFVQYLNHYAQGKKRMFLLGKV